MKLKDPYQILQVFQEGLSAEDIFKRILEELNTYFSSSRILLGRLTYDKSAIIFTYEKKSESMPSILGLSFSLKSLAKHLDILENKQTVTVKDISCEESLSCVNSTLSDLGVSSICHAPIMNNNLLRFVLIIDLPYKNHWTKEEINFIEICARVIESAFDKLLMQEKIIILKTSLENAEINAKSAEEKKESFLANISHELRTPLNGILGMADLLSESKLNNELHEYVSIIKSSGREMLNLVNDLIDYTRLELSSLELEESLFCLPNLVSEIDKVYRPIAERKNLQFILRTSDKIPNKIRSYPKRLLQIVGNFISNAIKFTNQGSIKVDINFSKQHELKISVTDSGIGIDQERIDYLFEPFKQLDGSATRKYGGLGLGLALAKKIATTIGYTIDVTSKIGQGSTFTLIVPIKDFKYEILPVNLPTKANKNELNILLVEDNIINQRLFITILEKQGHKVQLASNGKEAVDKFNESPCDIILMDCSMPVMDGFEATKTIRQSDNGSKVPIIALTALALNGDKERCLMAGMNDYLAKPLNSAELQEKITKFSS